MLDLLLGVKRVNSLSMLSTDVGEIFGRLDG